MRIARLILIASLLLFPSACYNAPDPGSRVAGGGPAGLRGAPAQSFDVPRTDGRIDGLAHYRGHVVLLNLWASWCPPCREEMPALETFAKSQRGRVVVLGVDQGESAQTAGAFAREHGVTFPILVDEGQQYGRTYVAAGLPTTVVVGRDGRVVSGKDGPMTLADMRAAAAAALAQR